ncbi:MULTISPECIES: DUF4054 domain-containing protein [unclassified Burkholderia]|uniref:DUF4054 domain-containing protein n=1 Tax=unclassified Burkholderia TaxID=2613784 RepID=UPI000F561AAB|nr:MULTISPECIES: DUF4054 domain-containing protein [unclassified Burkholderia]RQR87721.1 DUF4054 domain-containing protein [Burkholderia sp. Bp9011]RQR97064.1 DUF4054 domain-containing protein [Burkholderia sp. Bp9010]
MSVTAAQLRTDFPEFSDPTKYPDPLVNMWLTVANSLVNASRWAELTNLGVELVTCHHLAISARDELSSAAGGIPGEVKGATSAKSVDKVSASYDTSSVTLADAGFWNMTSYGIRFLGLARMMGAGGLQINC